MSRAGRAREEATGRSVAVGKTWRGRVGLATRQLDDDFVRGKCEPDRVSAHVTDHSARPESRGRTRNLGESDQIPDEEGFAERSVGLVGDTSVCSYLFAT